MDLIDKILEIWCKRYSKGTWTTKDGDVHYIEELSDNHLMRLPYFLKKKYQLDDIRYLPSHIRAEIEERNMIINPDTFYVSKKEMPRINVKKEIKSNKLILRTKTNRNKNLFNKLRR